MSQPIVYQLLSHKLQKSYYQQSPKFQIFKILLTVISHIRNPHQFGQDPLPRKVLKTHREKQWLNLVKET